MVFTIGHAYGKRFPKGIIPWNKGGTVAKIRDNGHFRWKVKKASRDAIHKWLYRRVGKASFCTFNSGHITTRYHWANISRAYKREVTDFMSLCPSCHFTYDQIGKKMWQTRRIN